MVLADPHRNATTQNHFFLYYLLLVLYYTLNLYEEFVRLDLARRVKVSTAEDRVDSGI